MNAVYDEIICSNERNKVILVSVQLIRCMSRICCEYDNLN